MTVRSVSVHDSGSKKLNLLKLSKDIPGAKKIQKGDLTFVYAKGNSALNDTPADVAPNLIKKARQKTDSTDYDSVNRAGQVHWFSKAFEKELPGLKEQRLADVKRFVRITQKEWGQNAQILHFGLGASDTVPQLQHALFAPKKEKFAANNIEFTDSAVETQQFLETLISNSNPKARLALTTLSAGSQEFKPIADALAKLSGEQAKEVAKKIVLFVDPQQAKPKNSAIYNFMKKHHSEGIFAMDGTKLAGGRQGTVGLHTIPLGLSFSPKEFVEAEFATLLANLQGKGLGSVIGAFRHMHNEASIPVGIQGLSLREINAWKHLATQFNGEQERNSPAGHKVNPMMGQDTALAAHSLNAQIPFVSIGPKSLQVRSNAEVLDSSYGHGLFLAKANNSVPALFIHGDMDSVEMKMQLAQAIPFASLTAAAGAGMNPRRFTAQPNLVAHKQNWQQPITFNN